jgi:hypothetical protein
MTLAIDTLGVCGISMLRPLVNSENRYRVALTKQSMLQYQVSPMRIPTRVCGTLRMNSLFWQSASPHAQCIFFQPRPRPENIDSSDGFIALHPSKG